MTIFKLSLLLLAAAALRPAVAQTNDIERLPLINAPSADERAENGQIEIDLLRLKRPNTEAGRKINFSDPDERPVADLSENFSLTAGGDSTDGEPIDLTSLERMPVELPKMRTIPNFKAWSKDRNR